MESDNLKLWKLKHGQSFLDTYLKYGRKVFNGEKCIKATSIRLFIRLGLFREIPLSMYSCAKKAQIKLGFTELGISIYDQLQKQINRGIIYKERSGEMNWNNFQFI